MGKYIFFDSTGEIFHVVGQVDASAGMLYDNVVLSFQTEIATADGKL